MLVEVIYLHHAKAKQEWEWSNTAVVLRVHQKVALSSLPDRGCASGSPVAMTAGTTVPLGSCGSYYCILVCRDRIYLHLTLARLSWSDFCQWWQTHIHGLRDSPAVSLSIYDFEMTGLLSVFSLLPIQNLKKRENGQEEDLEDSERLEGTQEDGGKLTLHDPGEAPDR